MRFSKEYDTATHTLGGSNDHLSLYYVESDGDDLSDLLSNAMISLTTWHGNEGPEWNLGDLPEHLQTLIERDMSEALACEAEYQAEQQREFLAEQRAASAENSADVAALNKESGRG